MKIEGEPLKRYRLGYRGEFLGSYDTATQAVERLDQHDQLIRPQVDPKRKGRYAIRDGRDKEITIQELRIAAMKERATKNKP